MKRKEIKKWKEKKTEKEKKENRKRNFYKEAIKALSFICSSLRQNQMTNLLLCKGTLIKDF